MRRERGKMVFIKGMKAENPLPSLTISLVLSLNNNSLPEKPSNHNKKI